MTSYSLVLINLKKDSGNKDEVTTFCFFCYSYIHGFCTGFGDCFDVKCLTKLKCTLLLLI